MTKPRVLRIERGKPARVVPWEEQDVIDKCLVTLGSTSVIVCPMQPPCHTYAYAILVPPTHRGSYLPSTWRCPVHGEYVMYMGADCVLIDAAYAVMRGEVILEASERGVTGDAY